MNFSPQQTQAVDEVAAWLKNPSQQTFYLAGYAGTGKTTLAKHLASQQNEPSLFAAYTGKAASVLRRKGCNASTIHKLIYRVVPPNKEIVQGLQKKLKGEENPQEKTILGEKIKEASKIRFELNEDSEIKECKLVIIDEVSMVDEKIGADLLSFGIKVLVLGDPGQLPPVAGGGYFTSRPANFTLTEIHRQAQGNPIIAMATMVRQGSNLKPGAYGDSKVLPWKTKPENSSLLAFDQLIVGRNATRTSLNSYYRDILGKLGTIPEKEEKIICLKNNHELGILNGTQWIVKKIEDNGNFLSMEIQDIDEPTSKLIQIESHHFDTDLKDLPFWDRGKLEEFAFGYAITCHKSQGSQWKNVFIQNEAYIFREDKSKWLYTALTRAEDRVVVAL